MLRFASLVRAGGGAQASIRPRFAAAAAAFSSQSHVSATRFDSLAITENSKRAIRQELKYDFMTEVQDKTFPHIFAGKDVLSKAKTGNGKTMAFLLPTIERMVSLGLDNTHNSIPLLIISPTRELAHQIATEARKIGQFHDLNVACFVGGTSASKDTAILKGQKPVDILVATPGRLLDHLSQDSAHIKKMLRKLRFLVLDEADRLLDMGFRAEIMKILESVPEERQTLLFSATLPTSTRELTKIALRKDFELVNTVSEDDHQTNMQVKQEYVVCAGSEVVSTLERVLEKHIALHPKEYKVIVFFPTARAAQFMAQLFTASGFKGTLEMHSRKSQVVRTKTADTFRKHKRVMMFSSDVSARGVDYPDVTLVVQVGLTDRDQYIHRLGRTARAGSAGHGVLVLSDFEKPLLHELKDLPMVELDAATEMSDHVSRTAATMASLQEDEELEKSAKQSYQAWLGFYNSNLKRLGIDKVQLVELAESYRESIGLLESPKLDLSILKKMGLAGTPGLEAAARGESRHRGSSVPRARAPSSDREDRPRARASSFDGSERTARSFDGERRAPRSDGERAPRSYDSDRAPRGDGERAPRSYDNDRRGPRGDGERRAPRSFDNDRRGSRGSQRESRPDDSDWVGRRPRASDGERPDRSSDPHGDRRGRSSQSDHVKRTIRSRSPTDRRGGRR